MSGWEVCYRCGGNPEFDEQGLPYACYICGNTGYVTKEVLEAHEAEEAAWRAEMEREAAEAARKPPVRYIPDDLEDY